MILSAYLNSDLLPNSRNGKRSFWIANAALVLLFLAENFAMKLAVKSNPETGLSTIAFAAWSCLAIAIVADLMGVCFGIIGLREKDTRKFFAVTGLIFSGVPLLIFLTYFFAYVFSEQTTYYNYSFKPASVSAIWVERTQ